MKIEIDKFLENTAVKVGKKILYYKRNNLIKTIKNQKNLKTNIDLIANDIWVKSIKNKFLDINILSEEMRIKKK